MPDDYTNNTSTTGAVEVGGSATGDIETRGDRDWFAVTLGAGTTYRIDLEGSETGAGALRDPYLRGAHDADGNLLAATTDDDDGAGYNSRVYFTAEEDATYYVAAGDYGNWRGTYTLSVADVTDDFEAGDRDGPDASGHGPLTFRLVYPWLPASRAVPESLHGSLFRRLPLRVASRHDGRRPASRGLHLGQGGACARQALHAAHAQAVAADPPVRTCGLPPPGDAAPDALARQALGAQPAPLEEGPEQRPLLQAGTQKPRPVADRGSTACRYCQRPGVSRPKAEAAPGLR